MLIYYRDLILLCFFWIKIYSPICVVECPQNANDAEGIANRWVFEDDGRKKASEIDSI